MRTAVAGTCGRYRGEARRSEGCRLTVRRLKTYASDTGRVYDYSFVEEQPALTSFGAAIEYVYKVSSDRHSSFAVSILVLDEAVADWATRHGRALGDNERYAAAKLALQRAFDEIEDMHQSGRQLQVGPEKLEELLAPLDL
jgi:hypothetical protein